MAVGPEPETIGKTAGPFFSVITIPCAGSSMKERNTRNVKNNFSFILSKGD
jgi:hypothetical protein